MSAEQPINTGPIQFLDANPVLRYLLRDHPEHSPRARNLIESEQPLRISIVTLAEIGYVLTRAAGVAREDAVDAMTDLLNRGNMATHEIPTDLAIQAMALCRPSNRVSFGDALLWAAARGAVRSRVWTFDRRFPAEGVEVVPP